MPEVLKALNQSAAALLVEIRAADPAALQEHVRAVLDSITHLPTVQPIQFTTDVAEFTQLWNIRKGMLPSAGAMRDTGTTVIIEDVAFPTEVLDRATLDCQALFQKHGYQDAIIFGHALEGNLHFVFPQGFSSVAEVERFRRFMDDLCIMVVRTYDGSLKAEHGTGRNIAPFVEMEWGRDAYALMKEIKETFDPEHLLNPGVILNDDPLIHLRNLKPLPAAHPLVDKCTECGFCESSCPSKDLTLTPRQRIVIYREISRLAASGQDDGRRQRLLKLYAYDGNGTCATDGLCAMACPVEIDTGKLIKHLRFEQHSALAQDIAGVLARHMGVTTTALRATLNLLDRMHRLLGTRRMQRAALAARRISLNSVPLWNRNMPRGAERITRRPVRMDNPHKAVYFPSCISRAMGTAPNDAHQDAQIRRTEALLRKAGYDIIYPENVDRLCCGMAFASKGFVTQGDLKLRELEQALMEASAGGAYPILFDTSPCLFRWREAGSNPAALRAHEPAEFINTYLCGRLKFHRLPLTVAVHVTCSARKMALVEETRALAELCAETVILPESVGCCAFAGDRGFTVPELNASALAGLKAEIPAECRSGYSTSRTCEIGMSLHGGIPYQSIIYLVDQATESLD
jgi:D-lactate dehydrogenase